MSPPLQREGIAVPKKSKTMGMVRKAAKATNSISWVSAAMARHNARKLEAE